MAPVWRFIIGPPHGSQPSNIVLRRPVPRVAVRNSPRKPMSAAARDAELEARAAEAGVGHLHHAAAALAEALGDDADERVGHVDDDELDRLADDCRRSPAVTTSGLPSCIS